MAEWSNAAVLKTVEGHTSGGSNPSLSAILLSVHLIDLQNTYNLPAEQEKVLGFGL